MKNLSSLRYWRSATDKHGEYVQYVQEIQSTELRPRLKILNLIWTILTVNRLFLKNDILLLKTDTVQYVRALETNLEKLRLMRIRLQEKNRLMNFHFVDLSDYENCNSIIRYDDAAAIIYKWKS